MDVVAGVIGVERDGAEIFREAARDSLKRMLHSIEWLDGLPKAWRRMYKELSAEMFKQQAKDDARVLRQRGRRADRAIAA